MTDQEQKFQQVELSSESSESTDQNSQSSSQPVGKKKLFGRGIYQSTDVPIRALDTFIAFLLVMAVGLTVWFTVKGGFYVSFQTNGANETIADQKLRYGRLVEEPEVTRAGYTLDYWSTTPEGDGRWYFSTSEVTQDVTLYAVWKPAEITVKFDCNGGKCDMDEKVVTYGQTYGELPVPKKKGSKFLGWYYSGEMISGESTVAVSGEHVLTAEWSD